MNPAIAAKGSSFKGAVQYITHDIGSNGTDRVSAIRTLNLRTDDPEKAAKVMAWTAEHAGELKRAAGHPATGRKTVDPVYHFALTWEPSQTPQFDDMVSAAQAALKVLGFERHEAVLAAHCDKPHSHIHVVVSRIDPETGLTVNRKGDFDRLQRWAWEYEKAHGHIYCVDRALRFEKDPALRADLQKRLAIEREQGKSAESQARPQWAAEREAPFPKSKAARDLRNDLASRSKALAANAREQADRQKTETSALWKSYQASKDALWERQRAEYRQETRAAVKELGGPMRRAQAAERADLNAQHAAERSAVFDRYRNQERAQIERLFRAQRDEFRSFLQTSHRGGFVGALATAIQAAREAKEPGKRGGFTAFVAGFLAAALNTDARARQFLDGQRKERARLREEIRRAQRPHRQHDLEQVKSRQTAARGALDERQRKQRREEEERAMAAPAYVRRVDTVRARHAQDRNALRSQYVADKSTLTRKHADERDALKARWAQLDADRRAAWSDYRRARTVPVQSRPALGATFQEAGSRTRDAGRSVKRSADAARTPAEETKATGRALGPGQP